MTLPRDYSVSEVAQALGMSKRWVYARIAEGAEHQRYGNRVRFTSEQVEQMRQDFAKTKAPAPTRRRAS